MREPVGILSTLQDPLLPYFLDLVHGHSAFEPLLIFDRKGYAEKDRRIFADRTGGRFPLRSLEPFLARITSLTVDDHNGADCRQVLRSRGIELVLNAGTPRLLKPEFLRALRVGVLNAHPGLLPKYRGASCCEWAIYNDDPVGVTAHFMDERVDGGPILFSRTLTIRRGEGYQEVRAGLYRLAHEVRVQALRRVIDEGLTATSLPAQADSPVFKPIPDELLEVVKAKLAGEHYAHAQ